MPKSISNYSDAVKRVRLLIDKSDSPYVTSEEIIRYLQIAISEYIQERIGRLGSSQELRDDLGDCIREVSYISPCWAIQPGDDGFPASLGDTYSFGSQGQYNYDELYGNLYFYVRDAFTGNNCVRVYINGTFAGEDGLVQESWSDGTEKPLLQSEGPADFGYLVSIVVRRFTSDYKAAVSSHNSGYSSTRAIESYPMFSEVKVVGLDEITSIGSDPFNLPMMDSLKAVRKKNYYEIYPATEFIEENNKHTAGSRPNGMRVILTYVMNEASFLTSSASGVIASNLSNTTIQRFPNHAREEICQLAARKILGTLSDERYKTSVNETQELRK